MTEERMQIFVNDRPVILYRGMQVRHALIACEESFYKAAKEGAVTVEDENGFAVGLEGALHEGARLYIKKKTKG